MCNVLQLFCSSIQLCTFNSIEDEMCCDEGDKNPEKDAVWRSKSVAVVRLLSYVRCDKAVICCLNTESTKWLEIIIKAADYTIVSKESPLRRKGNTFEAHIFQFTINLQIRISTRSRHEVQDPRVLSATRSLAPVKSALWQSLRYLARMKVRA